MNDNNNKTTAKITSAPTRPSRKVYVEILLDNLPSDFGVTVPSKQCKVKTDDGNADGIRNDADEPSIKKPRYNPDIANSKTATSISNRSNIDSDYNYSNDNDSGKVVQHNVVNGNIINGNIVNGRITHGRNENGSDQSCESVAHGQMVYANKKNAFSGNLSDISFDEDNNNTSFGCGVASYGNDGDKNKKQSNSKKKSRSKTGGAVSKNVEPYDNEKVAKEIKENIALSQEKKHALYKMHKSLSEKVSKLTVELREVQSMIYDHNERIFDWKFGIKDIPDDAMTVADKRYHKARVIKKFKKRIVKKSFDEVNLKSRISCNKKNMKNIETKIAIIDSTLITDVTAYNLNCI